MSDRRRRAATNKDTYEEFLSKLGVCGLCANHGILRMSGLTTPAGYPVEPVEGFCICPNGRVMASIARRHAPKPSV
jgi:hypothetical protein